MFSESRRCSLMFLNTHTQTHTRLALFCPVSIFRRCSILAACRAVKSAAGRRTSCLNLIPPPHLTSLIPSSSSERMWRRPSELYFLLLLLLLLPLVLLLLVCLNGWRMSACHSGWKDFSLLRCLSFNISRVTFTSTISQQAGGGEFKGRSKHCTEPEWWQGGGNSQRSTQQFVCLPFSNPHLLFEIDDIFDHIIWFCFLIFWLSFD